MEPRTLHANPRWLLAVVPDGLIGIGPKANLRIDFDASVDEKQRLLALLSEGIDAPTLVDRAGVDSTEAVELLNRLERVGALTAESPDGVPRQGTSLIRALLEMFAGDRLPDLLWTAGEALIVPAALPAASHRTLLRAFIGGIEPTERRLAYGYAARWTRPTVVGDVPDHKILEDAVGSRDLDPDAIHVVDLVRGTELSLDPAALGRLGADTTNRLGPVTGVTELHLAGGPPGTHLMLARRATPNLAHPDPLDAGAWGRGMARSRVRAERIARAEAAERYGMGDLDGRALERATPRELPDLLAPDRIFSLNARQYRDSTHFEPYDSEASYLWTPALTLDGSTRWVVAESVFSPFQDFGRDRRTASASSSGSAAHDDPAEARRRAFRELVERDAFMWTWIQRISRERIRHDTLPEAIRARAKRLAADDYETTVVNLTLETDPVVLCVLHRPRSLAVGACCAPDPARAAEKALDEATALLLAPGEPKRPEPSEVWSPNDHRLYYENRDITEAAFLFGSPETIELGEVAGAGTPIERSLSEISEPLTVDLSSPATHPFRVMRALAPGLTPISFGWDQEPLGMPGLAQPRTTADGRRLGSVLDLTTAGPLTPHPFA